MRKLGGLVLMILFVLGFLAVWQKERLITYFQPRIILTPFYKQPDVYDLLTLLDRNGITDVSSPVIIDKTIQATISGVTVYFAADKDLFTQVRSLQLVLPRLKMDGKDIKIVDLRFSKVVIR